MQSRGHIPVNETYS